MFNIQQYLCKTPGHRGSTRTVRALSTHRAKYLNNFPSRWSTGRGVVDGTYPPPPLQTPGLARDGLPGGGGETVAK